MTVRWAFWRSEPQPQEPPQEPPRAMPDDVGLRTPPRPPAAPTPPDPDDRAPSPPAARTSGATPSPEPPQRSEPPLSAPAPDLDRAALAAAGDDLAGIAAALSQGSVTEPPPDPRALAVAATGALAARLPELSGVDAGGLGEPQDELLHAYAELLASRTQHRPHADHEDLLAVVHLAAAAVAVDAADDPALLLLAGVPADAQLRAASLLLAQTADDGAGPLDRLAGEVRALFGTPG